MEKKIIVAHPGKQHSYKTASAIKKNGNLFKYITTIYNSENNLSIKLLKFFLPSNEKNRLNTRKNLDLEESDIVQFCVISGYIEAFLSRFSKMNHIYRFFQQFNADRFGKKVARYAIKNNVDAVIIYDSNAYKCFNLLNHKSKIIKIMDVSHINRSYQQDIVFNPKNNNKENIEDCLPYLFPKWYLKRIARENKNTDYFLVPSTFVAKSLEYSNINEKRIFEVPYGSNFTINFDRKEKQMGDKIVFLFVGKVSFAKGIPFLLQAFEQLNYDNVELRLVGEFDSSKWFYKKYCNKKNIFFIGKKLHNEVLDELKSSDVFVLPSLMEGMSLAGLEAMSCGLPIICTDSSGLDKFVDNERNGFVIESKNIEQIYEKMKWFVENKKYIKTQN